MIIYMLQSHSNKMNQKAILSLSFCSFVLYPYQFIQKVGSLPIHEFWSKSFKIVSVLDLSLDLYSLVTGIS